jgi:D-inositol-3-phosphate glycosyltransferase
VVAANAGGLALTVEDGRSGLLFPPDDHAALAAQIERIIERPDEAAELRAGARRRAAEYGWTSVARRITTIYEDLVADRQAARAAGRPVAQVS